MAAQAPLRLLWREPDSENWRAKDRSTEPEVFARKQRRKLRIGLRPKQRGGNSAPSIETPDLPSNLNPSLRTVHELNWDPPKDSALEERTERGEDLPENLKLMCVFAHPDDESLGAGGTLAKYAAEGIE